jgi:hypothetical protein
MRKYKVFYFNTLVAEYNTLKECKDYVLNSIKIDKDLDISDFYIYGLIG